MNKYYLCINFHNDKVPKEVCQCIYLAVLLIDSVYRTCKNCYCQVFEEKKIPEYIAVY